MAEPTTTFLVEDLRRLAAALPPEARFPALERVLARGKPRRIASGSPNHLRFHLFGTDPGAHLPVAALTRVSEQGEASTDGRYWLRADPVSMRPDMTRVFMTAWGFGDYDAAERLQVNRVVADALRNEGIDVPGATGDCWCFPLPQALPFEFTPLHAALGVDLAEVLPGHEDATRWKRIMTEIQVGLHQDEGNETRRRTGRQTVNSVWFWGGGSLPGSVRRRFDAVFSDDPVTRGLALQSGCRPGARDDAAAGDGAVLIDWTMASADAVREAEALELAIEKLIENSAVSLLLVDGGGRAWRYGRREARRFWMRTRPLADSPGIRPDDA